jgi:hypothetical protein
MALRDNAWTSPACPADLEPIPLLGGRSAAEKTLPPKVDGSGLRSSLEGLDERFFLAAAATFLPDTFRRFDCFARAVKFGFRAAFFLFVLLRFCPRRLLSAIRKMYHYIAG